MLVTIALVAVLLMWWRDRQELERRLVVIESMFAPPPTIVGRRWGPEQATGPPDTKVAGDQVSAWASGTPDGQPEWLELRYEKAIKPYEVEVHESYNPGALTKITAFDEAGREVILWQGTDPLSGSAGMGIATIELQKRIRSSRFRIYLASDQCAGWNEIDAVGVRYGWGWTLWAQSAKASSIYGVSLKPLSSSEQPIVPEGAAFQLEERKAPASSP